MSKKAGKSLASLEQRLSGYRHWQLLALALCLLTSFYITAPFFNLNYIDFRLTDTVNWNILEAQGRHVLQPLAERDFRNSHVEKMSYRLFVPVVMQLTEFKRYEIFILQSITSILILLYSIKTAYRITHDRLTATLFSIALTACYFTYTGSYDVFGRLDSFGLLFMLLAIYSKRPFQISLFCFFSFWCDERCIINIGWVYLFHCYEYYLEKACFTIKNLFSFHTNWFCIFIALLCYLAGRFFLQHQLGFSTGTQDVGSGPLLTNSRYMFPAIFSAYGAVWVLVIYAAGLLFTQKKLLLLVLIVGQFLLSLLSSVVVFDVTRGISYAFIMVFIALLVLHRNMEPKPLTNLLWLCAAAVFFVPIITWDGNYHYIPNLFIRLAETFLH